MGLAIERESFEPIDYERFAERLSHSLEALGRLLARPDFGRGATTLGAELELALVGEDAQPLPVNLAVIGESLDPRLTVELDRFNLECNLRYTALAGRPFGFLRAEMEGALAEVRRAARRHGGRPVAIGILPTLTEWDLQSHAMTDTPRFRALSSALQQRRGGTFDFRIDGEDPLVVSCNDVTFEGAATSLQLHLRVEPDRFASLFNAAQLATPPVLAISGNSPTFLGHSLWSETRVALFKQAVDDRNPLERHRGREARVSFGRGWVRDGALELFREAVETHEALLPVLGSEDPLACLARGATPALEEIRLHQGTVWAWNRPVYDPGDGGHLRIELRALPSGPSVTDMLANAALLVGLTLGLAPEIDAIVAEHPFAQAHRGFYRAAQHGMDSALAWPGVGDAVSAPALVQTLLPTAQRGLIAAGVDADEVDALLGVISARCEARRTGASWQRETLAQLQAQMSWRAAISQVVERYIELSESGLPVHEWQPDLSWAGR